MRRPGDAVAPPRAAPQGVGSIPTQGGLVVKLWDANSSNVASVSGRVLLNGAPVAGAQVALDAYRIPQVDGQGRELPHRRRHHDPGEAHGPGRRARRTPPCAGRRCQRASAVRLLAASGGFSVGYGLQGLRARVQKDGSVLVTGRLLGASSQAPPTVRLLTYQLAGTITDATGKPVQGAVVITRTQDRDFWTHSSASDANGHYTSFFAASDETNADPVILAVGVASGGISYGGTLGTNASFKRLRSAVMNIKLGAGDGVHDPGRRRRRSAPSTRGSSSASRRAARS